ncbi:MAG: penicillin-binding protein 2 [Peptococcaceae bacterium]|nr:penicillin-binding protein 2 [Peptococcaceae bacterium]
MFEPLEVEQDDKYKRFGKRSFVFVCMLLLLFFVLAARLFALQILNSETYASISSRNQLRIVSQPAKRGDIYDRNMLKLAGSEICFEISISTAKMTSDEIKELAHNLAGFLKDPELNEEAIIDKIDHRASNYQPVVITTMPAENNQHLVASLEENRDKLPGLLIIETPQRVYLEGSLASHVLGQVGKITDADADLVQNYNYLSTDLVGKAGVERTMERFTDTEGREIGLRGKRGLSLLEVDSQNRIVREISNQESVSGNSLVLTIDADIQRVMEDSLAETVEKLKQERPKVVGGSAVLLDVKTGSVLAMASYPDYEPEDFIKGIDSEKAAYYYDETLKPTFNRAISGAYPVGSTFKVSTALAALACGAIGRDTHIFCDPENWDNDKAKCTGIHGMVDLSQALAVSCNTYAQDAGAAAGIDNMYEVFRQLGYGQLTGIELTGETRGLLANPDWKKLNFKGREGNWYPYDTYYMSIGQGYSYYTTLQMAQAMATIANHGVRMQPHVVDRIIDYEGETVYQWEPRVMDRINMSDENWDVLYDALQAVTQPGGTAYRTFGNYPVSVAAKTGTAQTGLVGDDKNNDYHGWFVAFAPADDPEVAFAGMVEYGFHGFSSGGVVCKDVFDAYFGFDGSQTVSNVHSSVVE